MKKIGFFKKALVIICVLAMTIVPFSGSVTFAADKSGVTYYVSSSKGNDSNSGKSESEPWKTFSNIKNLKLSGGDKVLLKCDDVWVGEQLVINSAIGTKENPVLLSSYGEGKKPSILGFETTEILDKKIAEANEQEVEVPNDPLVFVVDPAGFEIKNLDIGINGVGIDLRYVNSYDNEYVRVEGCHFHSIYGFTQHDTISTADYPLASGLFVTRECIRPLYDHPSLIGFYIHNCTTEDAGLLSYGRHKPDENTGATIQNLYMTDCVMNNNGYYGTVVAGVKGGFMDNCKIYKAGLRRMPPGTLALMLSCEDFTIMNCDLGFTQRQADDPDGTAIDLEHYCYDVTIRNNYIHDNSGVGIMFYQSHSDETHQNKRCKIINNVFANNNLNPQDVNGAEIISVPYTSLVNSLISGNWFLKKNLVFDYSIEASNVIENTVEYKDYDKCPWPLEPFDKVRKEEAPEFFGKPTKDVSQKQKTNTEKASFNFDWLFFGGAAIISIVIIAAIYLLNRFVFKRRKRG